MQKKTRLIKSIQMSYLLILVIGIVVMSVSYLYTETVLKKELINSEKLVLSLIKNDMDSILENQRRVALRIALSDNVSRMLGTHELDRKERYTLEQEIRKELQNAQSSQMNLPGIENIYVYFDKLDLVITPGALVNGETFSRTYYDWGADGYSKWKKLMNDEFKQQYYVLDNCKNIAGSRKTIAVMMKTPIDNRYSYNSAIVVVALQADNFISYVKENSRYDEMKVTVLDEKGYGIFDSSNYDFLDLKKENTVKDNTFYFTQKSNVNSWSYLMEIDKNKLMHQVVYARILIFLVVFIILAIGVLLSKYFAAKQYTPINKIMKKLSGDLPRELQGAGNEYEFILNSIDETVAEKNEIERRFNQQITGYKKRFLSLLLNNKVSDYENIRQLLETLHMSFDTDNFIVAVIYPAEQKMPFSEENDISDEKRTELYELMISNVVEELFNDEHKCHVLSMGTYMAAVININDNNEETAPQYVAETLQTAWQFFRKNFNFTLCIAVSTLKDSFSKLSACYYEACELVKQMERNAEHGVALCKGSVDGDFNNWRTLLNKDKDIVNFVRAGNSEGANQVVSALFLESDTADALVNKRLYGFCYSTAGTIYKLTEDRMSVSERQMYTEYIQKFAFCATTQEIQNLMMQVIDFACGIVERENDKMSIGAKIKQYVLLNYSNYTLSVSAMAEHFGITPTHLSRVFKKEFDELLVDYIMRVRVETAITLLEQTDNRINDIANMVGYQNTKSMTHAFKKIVGVSPNQYRKSAAPDDGKIKNL